MAKDMVVAELLVKKGLQETGEPQQRSAYRLGTINVCSLALLRILGISQQRAQRLRAGRVDERFGKRCAGDPRGKRSSVFSQIFGHLWHGAGPAEKCVFA